MNPSMPSSTPSPISSPALPDTLPAIAGGKPVREKMLPYGWHQLDDADINAVVEVLKGDFLTTGPKIKEFEEVFAAYVGAKYAVAVANGTAALHAATFAAGIGPRDEVITSPITFVASANCVLYMGGKPVFADIKAVTYNIDPQDIEKRITGRTKAIIPVHFSGQPVDLEEIHAIAKRHNLIVIEDAAHALGAEYKGKKIGGLSDMTIFSFHPVKHITTGEGGMITTNNPELYEKLLLFRNHGITRDPAKLTENQGPWYYEMQALGYNYRITDIQAALGISQLTKSEEFLALRRRHVSLYNDAFAEIPEIIVPFQEKDRQSAWHLYIIQLNPERLKTDRRQVFEALRAENIGVNVHYIPVYRQPYYQTLGYKQGDCPRAEELYEKIISLPLYPGMKQEDVSDVIKAVQKVINYYRR